MKHLAWLPLVLLTSFTAAPAAAEPVSPDLRVPSVVQIPAIGLEASIVPVGLEEDGAMAAPDPDTVGWYEFGPGAGAPGNAILAGHVDWGGTLRTFGLIHRLTEGDVVTLTDIQGETYQYRVQWSQLVDAESAPLEEIFAQGTTEELTLITCGGTFDSASRQYLGRLIVRAMREPVLDDAPAEVWLSDADPS